MIIRGRKKRHAVIKMIRNERTDRNKNCAQLNVSCVFEYKE